MQLVTAWALSNLRPHLGQRIVDRSIAHTVRHDVVFRESQVAWNPQRTKVLKMGLEFPGRDEILLAAQRKLVIDTGTAWVSGQCQSAITEYGIDELGGFSNDCDVAIHVYDGFITGESLMAEQLERPVGQCWRATKFVWIDNDGAPSALNLILPFDEANEVDQGIAPPSPWHRNEVVTTEHGGVNGDVGHAAPYRM